MAFIIEFCLTLGKKVKYFHVACKSHNLAIEINTKFCMQCKQNEICGKYAIKGLIYWDTFLL